MTDEAIYFALWLGAILIALGLCCAFEHFICWLLGIDDPIEEHSEKPNPL